MLNPVIAKVKSCRVKSCRVKIINWTAMFLITLLYGCSSVPKEQPGSGFLSQYRGLTLLESPANERYFSLFER